MAVGLFGKLAGASMAFGTVGFVSQFVAVFHVCVPESVPVHVLAYPVVAEPITKLANTAA